MEPTDHFELDGFMKWLFLAAPWIFGAFALLGAGIPFLSDDGQSRNEAFLRGVSAVLTLFFGAAAWYSWRITNKLPHAAVSLDAEGIWPTVESRTTALVRWQQVAHLRERPMLQRLELLDASKGLLLRLEYQLADFPRLRNIVLSRASLDKPKLEANRTFSKTPAHHVFNVGALVGFSALALYMLQVQPLLGALLGVSVVGFGGWEYANTVHKVRVQGNELTLYWPGRAQRLRREEVQAFQIEDLLVNFARHPQVVVQCVAPTRSFKLRNLGVPAVELERTLLAWRNGAT